MKSIQLRDSVEGAELVEAEVSGPTAGPGELLIRVYAVGVTPTELLWYPTSHTKDGGPRRLAVPGHEFSGVIAAVGEGASGFEIGQEVYGMNDWFADGATAEYCVTLPAWIAPKPSSTGHVEAASVPIGALTAWQGLFDRAKLQSGERVLVQGGAGAVGIFAVQLAKQRGAHVMATASARNLKFVAELGAEQVMDYRAARLEDAVRDVDVVFDTVGGETLERSWGLLAADGRMVTVAAGGESTRDDRTKQAFFIVEPNQEQLLRIGRMLDSRELRTVVDTVLPLSEARGAYLGKVERQGRGKMVVAVAKQGPTVSS